MTNWESELQLQWQGQLDDLVTAVACAPNGQSWAATSAAGEVGWNPQQQDLIKLQTAVGESIDCVAFSANSRWLAAGGQSGQLLIWDCADVNCPPQLVHRINIGQWIENLAWHPIESQLAVSYGPQVEIWDLPVASAISTYRFDQSSIFKLAWHPDGIYLAMTGSKGIQIWAYRDQTAPIRRIEIETASLEVAWSQDGRYLAAGNLDRTLTIVDWHHPIDQWTLAGCPGKIRQTCWVGSSSTPCLAVASGIAIVIWQLEPDATAWTGQYLEGHQDIVTALVAHPHTPMIGSGGADGYVCLWSLDGEIHQIITADPSQFTALGWQSNAEYLLIGSQLGSIELWAMPA